MVKSCHVMCFLAPGSIACYRRDVLRKDEAASLICI